MKACLMRVNYNPSYTTPHKALPAESFKGRLSQTRDIYGTSEKQLRQNLEEAAQQKRAKVKVILRENGLYPEPVAASCPPSHSKKTNLTNEVVAKRVLNRNSGVKEDGENKASHLEQHKEGVAKAHHSIRLQPLKRTPSSYVLPSHSAITHRDSRAKLFSGPNTEKLPRRQINLLSQNNYRMRISSGGPHHDHVTSGMSEETYQRSKTVPPGENSPIGEPLRLPRPPGLAKLEKKARREAERAMKDKKVFTIMGPYHSLRAALRRRGWVERFTNAPSPSDIITSIKQRKSTDDSHEKEEDLDEYDIFGNKKDPSAKPWEEDNGLYGMMSHVVRNTTPTFVFSVKTVDVDSKVTKNGQLVNHFSKARSFTTKTGLCQHIRNTLWFDMVDHNTFYPRCYKFDEPTEKEAFIDDYRLSACFGFLKCFVAKYKYVLDKRKEGLGKEPIIVKPGEEYAKTEESREEQEKQERESKPPAEERDHSGSRLSLLHPAPVSQSTSVARGGPTVPVRAYEMALQQALAYLRFRSGDDIDVISERENQFSASQWDVFINWYYQFTHEGGEVSTVTDHMVEKTEGVLERVQENWPQYLMDGYNNVWILKPGAMSRGRGISCERRLNLILGSIDEEDDTMVVQKYIERPLLVYNTKFDIRQWFLVTDWNPLTVWFYKDCYLRFCSQEFTLDDFHEAIHLSNNSIQKNYDVDEKRSQQLPEDNMWTSEEFDIFLRQHGHGNIWQEKVVEGMKNAITCVMLCTQEFVEPRKGAFELYGADFMLTEDLSPWLIEINSSPSMARNTRATSKLVDNVLEDTLKVVLDRREDKTCDTGRFELIYRQGLITDPPTVDHSLAVVGKKVKQIKFNKTSRDVS